MNLSRNRMLLTAGLIAASLTLPVMSDPPADGKGDGKMGGPPVGDKAQRGRDGFGAGKDGKGGGEGKAREGMTERRNPQAWHRAMESVMPTLSDDQKNQIKALREEFEGKVKEWQAQNGDKEKELREKIRAAGEQAAKNAREARENGGGKDGGAGDGKGGEGRGAGGAGDGKGGAPDGKPRGQRPQIDPALMKEMQDLKATMPNPTEMQQKAFAILNSEQQAAFKENFDKFQKDGGPARRPNAERGGEGMGEKPGENGERPARRPANGRPFNFDEKSGDKPAQDPAKKNGDGKPSGS